MHRFSPKFALRPAAVIACAAAIVSLSGCAGISGSAVSSSLAASIPAGSVHGGQQPIQGAHIYVYEASQTGTYGSASLSKITPTTTGALVDGNGNYYVTTDASGGFSYAGATMTCTTPSSQVYLVALGGNATGFQSVGNINSNSAIALGAALGTCSNITASTFTSINEVTTVALGYALSAFMTDATHVGTTPTNIVGLTRAFTTAATLVDNTTGTALVTAANGGVLPQKKINSLANSIAVCANSGSATSTACTNLKTFTNASANDTLSAVLALASQPTFNPQAVYNIAQATAPFQPSLASNPADWSLGVVYTPTVTVTQPGALVIDGTGNIWMTNCQSCVTATATDSLVEFGPDGTTLHSYTASGIHKTQGLAFDANSTYLYSTNQAVTGSTHTADEVTKILASNGSLVLTTPNNPTDFGTGSLAGIALDNSGNVWVTAPAAASSNVLEFDTGFNQVNGSPYNAATGIQAPTGVATDTAGNIWVAGYQSNNLGKFTSAGAVTVYSPTVSSPQAISINGNNEIWTVNTNNNTVSRVQSTGANASGSPYSGIGIYDAIISAIDGSNHTLITDCRNGCNVPGGNQTGSSAPDNLLKLNQDGTPATGPNPGTYGVEIDGGFLAPAGFAVDASGNVWVANNGNGTLSEVIGFASPTVQPLAAASLAGTIGTRP